VTSLKDTADRVKNLFRTESRQMDAVSFEKTGKILHILLKSMSLIYLDLLLKQLIECAYRFFF